MEKFFDLIVVLIFIISILVFANLGLLIGKSTYEAFTSFGSDTPRATYTCPERK